MPMGSGIAQRALWDFYGQQSESSCIMLLSAIFTNTSALVVPIHIHERPTIGTNVVRCWWLTVSQHRLENPDKDNFPMR
jgi:hypothetical protein